MSQPPHPRQKVDQEASEKPKPTSCWGFLIRCLNFSLGLFCLGAGCFILIPAFLRYFPPLRPAVDDFFAYVRPLHLSWIRRSCRFEEIDALIENHTEFCFSLLQSQCPSVLNLDKARCVRTVRRDIGSTKSQWVAAVLDYCSEDREVSVENLQDLADLSELDREKGYRRILKKQFRDCVAEGVSEEFHGVVSKNFSLRAVSKALCRRGRVCGDDSLELIEWIVNAHSESNANFVVARFVHKVDFLELKVTSQNGLNPSFRVRFESPKNRPFHGRYLQCHFSPFQLFVIRLYSHSYDVCLYLFLAIVVLRLVIFVFEGGLGYVNFASKFLVFLFKQFAWAYATMRTPELGMGQMLDGFVEMLKTKPGQKDVDPKTLLRLQELALALKGDTVLERRMGREMPSDEEFALLLNDVLDRRSERSVVVEEPQSESDEEAKDGGLLDRRKESSEAESDVRS